MSLCSPCAAEPLGSWSPDFSVRVVTQARGGAGRKQNGLPRQLAGVPMATRALKVCISLAGDRSPQRHRGCREAESGSPPAGWFPRGFFFLPLLSFSRTKKKEGVRAAHSRERSTGWYPAYLPKPDRTRLSPPNTLSPKTTPISTTMVKNPPVFRKNLQDRRLQMR